MHLIRRSALRAISSPSTSFIASSKFVSAAPFKQTVSVSLFRRAFSDESKPFAADGEQSHNNSASEQSTPLFSMGGDRGGNGYNDRRTEGYSGGNERGGFRGAPREFTPRESIPSPTIYVGNLIFDATAKDIEREFESFGTISNVVVATDSRGLSKGFAYVTFETQEHAAAAIEAKHQAVMDGRRLVVNYQTKTTRDKTENPPSKTLFIGNLAFEMSDADLNKLFRDIRNVIDVRVAIDRRTGQPRGFAHADFVDVDSAVKAKEMLTEKQVYGRQLRVDFSAGSRQARSADNDGGRRD